MDLVKRAGQLKPMLVNFALSPLFDRELTAVVAQEFPDMIVDDERMFSMVLDHFVLQHRLESGITVVEAFVAAHSELTAAERDMLLGWRDVVEGMFEVTGKDRDAVILFNVVDELTYRAWSNLGRGALRQLKKGMIAVGRLVPVGESWMVSGNLAVFPASARDVMLASAAQQALSNPEMAFRNPAKLAEARSMVARQHEAFADLFGSDLIVVPGIEMPDKVQEFDRHWAKQVCPDEDPPEPVSMDFPDDLLDADSVAIHFVAGEGMSFYPRYHLLEELFRSPTLIARRPYREALSDCLRDPDASPELLRRLAARDPAKASTVFAKLLKRKRGFSWEADGEALLRKYKPSYFDGTLLPHTVVLSKPCPMPSGTRSAERPRWPICPARIRMISLDITEVVMTDILVRDVPEDVVAALDTHAGRLGLSRSEYVRRRLAQDAARQDSPVSVEDLAQFADIFGDLADPDVMSQAWR